MDDRLNNVWYEPNDLNKVTWSFKIFIMKRYTLVIAVVYDNPIEHWLFELNIELIGAFFI